MTSALLLLAIPAVGGLIVGLIQFKLTKSGVIYGVPEVIESLARNKGEIKANVGANKAVTATATLASGGSGRHRRTHHLDRLVARLGHRSQAVHQARAHAGPHRLRRSIGDSGHL